MRKVVNPISTGTTASVLNIIQNGVSSIGILTIVLYAHRMLGSSSGHSPFAPSSWVLMSLSKDRFVTSTCPLAYGWLGDE